MDIIRGIIDFILHVDEHLGEIIRTYGFWTYVILFAIIFCETGLVVTPFLPGDSLLFAAGALAALYPETLNVVVLALLLMVAAIIGDSVNYALGTFLGTRAFEKYPRIFRAEYLERTQHFYEKYGGKTIILARFVPIVRTFAPFIAGVGGMDYAKFITYNVAGGILWVSIFVFGGFLLGNIPIIQHNFEIVTILIILISVVPMVVEFIQSRRAPSTTSQAEKDHATTPPVS